MGRLTTFSLVYKWSIAGDLLMNITKPPIMWGLVALTCADMLGIFSLQFVRTRSYNLFVVTHAVGLIILLFAVSTYLAD